MLLVEVDGAGLSRHLAVDEGFSVDLDASSIGACAVRHGVHLVGLIISTHLDAETVICDGSKKPRRSKGGGKGRRTYIAGSSVARKVDTGVDRVHHTDGVELGLEVLQAGTEEVGGGVDCCVSCLPRACIIG